MLTLVRRYPLVRGGASRAGSVSMATPEDEAACRMDFDPKASSAQVSLGLSQWCVFHGINSIDSASLLTCACVGVVD